MPTARLSNAGAVIKTALEKLTGTARLAISAIAGLQEALDAKAPNAALANVITGDGTITHIVAVTQATYDAHVAAGTLSATTQYDIIG